MEHFALRIVGNTALWWEDFFYRVFLVLRALSSGSGRRMFRLDGPSLGLYLGLYLRSSEVGAVFFTHLLNGN